MITDRGKEKTADEKGQEEIMKKLLFGCLVFLEAVALSLALCAGNPGAPRLQSRVGFLRRNGNYLRRLRLRGLLYRSGKAGRQRLVSVRGQRKRRILGAVGSRAETQCRRRLQPLEKGR